MTDNLLLSYDIIDNYEEVDLSHGYLSQHYLYNLLNVPHQPHAQAISSNFAA